MRCLASLLVVGVSLLLLAADGESQQPITWDFEDAVAGKLPSGWSASKTGTGEGSVWRVTSDADAPGGANVLTQCSSAGPNGLFNLCVADVTRLTDVDLTVSFKALNGDLDQGGGPVWRYQDADNYYVCRMNPLEDNFRVYKLVQGRRIQLGTANVEAPAGRWHTIRAVQQGNHIQCYLNGKLWLDVKDDTFSGPGKIGVWTKADAMTEFDRVLLMPAGADASSGAFNDLLLRQQIAAIQSRLPDQSHAMRDVAYHFGNLWFAADLQNWPLANFYWKETQAHLRWAVAIKPVRKDAANQVIRLHDILQSMEKTQFVGVTSAIEKQDRQTFQTAYRQTIEACYDCHKASAKPYLRPQVPQHPPEPIINFDPSAVWPR